MPHHVNPIDDDIQTAQAKLERSMTPLLVGTREAAHILGLSASTLEKWRFFRTPGTPPVVRIGRACRYRLDDLRTWVDQASKPE